MASGTSSELAESEVLHTGEVPAEGTFPRYQPYSMEPVPPSLAETIATGRNLRVQHKATPKKTMRPVPKPAKPRRPKVTDVKMSMRQLWAHSRCLRRHGAVLTDRLERMSKPRRRNIIYLWREHADILPSETIARLRSMLDADEPFKPDQAYEYFINLRRTKKAAAATRGVTQIKKDLMTVCGDKKFAWARNATVSFARGIQQRLSRPGHYALDDRMLRLSDIVLGEMCAYMRVRTPSRRSSQTKAKYMLEMADKVAIWIDEIMSEADDRMLMMDFDEDEDMPEVDGAGDAGFADDFLNMMAGGGQLAPPKPAYLKFTGAMQEAFKLLTDAMYKKASAPLASLGKFQQTYAEAADELRQATDFDATEFDTKLASQINDDLSATVNANTPARIKPQMKEMVDICSNYLAQNAEINKDKGPAFKLLLNAMRKRPDEPLYKNGKAVRNNAQAAKELENARGLESDHDEPNLSQEIRSKLSKVVDSITPSDLKTDMAETLDISSKYLSQRAVDENERGPAFDILINELEKSGANSFTPEDPVLATNNAAAHALKNAPGLTVSNPDGATAPKFVEALHNVVDAVTPPNLKNEMKEVVDRSGDYLSTVARDRSEALELLLKMMKSSPDKKLATRNNFSLNYGTGATELQTAPALIPYLPVKDIADEIKTKLTTDMESSTPAALKMAMKALIKDASGHLSQVVALKSGAAGDRYPMNLQAAVMKSLGKRPLYKHKGLGQTYADAAEVLKFAGVLEEDPKCAPLAQEILTEMNRGFSTVLSPTLCNPLQATMDSSAKHLAKIGTEKGEAFQTLIELMKQKGDLPIGMLQGYQQTYNNCAKRLENATSLANDKVDKGAYESVRSKLKALVPAKLPPHKQKHMAEIIDEAAKYLASPFPENEMEKRQIVADLMLKKGDKILAEDGIYKMTYKEGAEEIMNGPVGKTTAQDQNKANEILDKIDDAIPDQKLKEILKVPANEAAAHLADVMKGRGEAMKAIYDELKHEPEKQLINQKNAKITQGEAADKLATAKNFSGGKSSQELVDKVKGGVGALNTKPATQLGKDQMDETSTIASKYIAGEAVKESGGSPGGAGGGPRGAGGSPERALGGPGGVGGSSKGAGGGPAGAGGSPERAGGGAGGVGGSSEGAGGGPAGTGGSPERAGGGAGGAGGGPGGVGGSSKGAGGGPAGAGGSPERAGGGAGGVGGSSKGAGGGPAGAGGSPERAGGGAGGVGGSSKGAGGGPAGAGGSPERAGGGAGGAGGGPGGVGGSSKGAGGGPAGAGGSPERAGGGAGGAGGGHGGVGGSSKGAGGGPAGAGGSPERAGGGPEGAGSVIGGREDGVGGGRGGGGGGKGSRAGAGGVDDEDDEGGGGRRGGGGRGKQRRRTGHGTDSGKDAEVLLQRQLRARGGETFYQQPQTQLTHAQAADWLTKPSVPVDKSVRESGDTARLSNKFERKLSDLVSNVTPPEMADEMQDVIIESSRKLSEYFVSSNYKALVREALISGMQKRGNEILIEVNGAAETSFFAAQRLKDKPSLVAREPCNQIAYHLTKKLEEIMKCAALPRKLTFTMKDHIKDVADYLSEYVTKPEETIEAYVSLLGEMEAAGDKMLFEKNITKSFKDCASYLRQLTSNVDKINLPNGSMQSDISDKLKSIMSNVVVRGYSPSVLDKVIGESTKFLVSYIMLQEKKTEALKVLISKMDEVGDKVLLRHGSIIKPYTEAAAMLRGKNTDQLAVASAEPVITRKIYIKLDNLMLGTAQNIPLMSDVIEDATNYLAVYLLEPQIINVCKCMKSVFVQCEMWCEEILRRVSRPRCTCSRHTSSSSSSHSYATTPRSGFLPGLDINIISCPSQQDSDRHHVPGPCPATAPDRCPGTRERRGDSTSYLLYDIRPTRLSAHTDEQYSQKSESSRSFSHCSAKPYSSAPEHRDGSNSNSSFNTSPSTINKEGENVPFWHEPTTMFVCASTSDQSDARIDRLEFGYERCFSNAPFVSTDQMSDWHAMIVSLMWNVQAWRGWLQENIDRALLFKPRPNIEGQEHWQSYEKRVAKEALQWRQYNAFSRQLTLRLALRYRDKRIVSPTRATAKTESYMECQREMLTIINMFNEWTQWFIAVLKETASLQPPPGVETLLDKQRWEHFKRKVKEHSGDWTKYNMHLKTSWERKYKMIISDWLPGWQQTGPVWVVSACGAVPSGAVAAGVFQEEITWVARTIHKCNVLPAALVPSKHCCLVYADGGVHQCTKYQVMCNAAVRWVGWRAGTAGNKCARAVRVAPGVHVGRVLHRGSHLVGAVLAPQHCCHVVMFGRPFAFNCYELLVLANDE